DTDTCVTDQFHCPMGNRGARPQKQYRNRSSRDQHDPLLVYHRDGAVLPVDMAAFQIKERHAVPNLRESLQIGFQHSMWLLHRHLCAARTTVSIAIPYAFPLPIPCVKARQNASGSVTCSTPSYVTDSSVTRFSAPPLR